MLSLFWFCKMILEKSLLLKLNFMRLVSVWGSLIFLEASFKSKVTVNLRKLTRHFWKLTGSWSSIKMSSLGILNFEGRGDRLCKLRTNQPGISSLYTYSLNDKHADVQT